MAAGTDWGPPWVKHRYDTLDYVLIPDKWKNACTNCEADPGRAIPSDHFPIKLLLRAKLRAKSQTAQRTTSFPKQPYNNMLAFAKACES